MRGAPDRWFGKELVTFLVEFKSKDGVLSAQQLLRYKELWEHFGMTVYVIASQDDANRLMRKYGVSNAQ